eukprot:9487140-Pyramimonas_sp.AAC.1
MWFLRHGRVCSSILGWARRCFARLARASKRATLTAPPGGTIASFGFAMSWFRYIQGQNGSWFGTALVERVNGSMTA